MTSPELEALFQQAQELGQDPALLAEIRAGRSHPAMAAFGLWKDEELDAIMEEVIAERRRPSARSAVKL